MSNTCLCTPIATDLETELSSLKATHSEKVFISKNFFQKFKFITSSSTRILGWALSFLCRGNQCQSTSAILSWKQGKCSTKGEGDILLKFLEHYMRSRIGTTWDFDANVPPCSLSQGSLKRTCFRKICGRKGLSKIGGKHGLAVGAKVVRLETQSTWAKQEKLHRKDMFLCIRLSRTRLNVQCKENKVEVKIPLKFFLSRSCW